MAETLQRTNSTEENLAYLRYLQTLKEVQDVRTKDELEALFLKVNVECSKRLVRNTSEKTQKTELYGPIPGSQSGKWWGIRIDCSRDGVHKPLNENVHHGPIGAISVCTLHVNTYNDVDLGNLLTITGQEYSDNDKSKDSLTLSHKNKVPLRLVRSYSLANEYSPKTGFRYDGLYTVIKHWISTQNNKKYHKFALVRVLNQDRPVWAEKISRFSNILSCKKSLSPRLTRSLKKVCLPKGTASKFVYNKNVVKQEPNVGAVSAIVSRQVFNKSVTGSPDRSPKSSSLDSSNFCSISKKTYNTNLSIRTNLYNSSCNSQCSKKTTNFTFKSSAYLKSNHLLHYSRKQETEKTGGTDTSDTEGTDKTPSISYSSADECFEKNKKKITWSDSCDSPVNGITNKIENGYQYNGSNVIAGFNTTQMTHRLTVNNNISTLEQSSTSASSKMKNFQHVAQIHSVTSPTSFKLIHCKTDNTNEESTSIDSLAPDKLVSIIIKEKYHPMAKLLIGNMIGLENGESEILGAYNTLVSKANQDNSVLQAKENKQRNKFFIRNKTRKTSGVLKKQRREIANLMIDAKFDPVARGLRNRRLRSPKKRVLSKSETPQRKLINGRRISSRNNKNSNKDVRSTVIEIQPKKIEKRKHDETIAIVKRPKMINSGIQCSLLLPPSVDKAVQSINESVDEVDDYSLLQTVMKTERESVDNETTNLHETSCQTESTSVVRNNNSAFAAVNTIDSSVRIAKLRSIGFRPIENITNEQDNDDSSSNSRPDVDKEYNKYTSEETNEVAYMDQELHYEDIEDEVSVMDAKKICELEKKQNYKNLSPRSVESLLEKDFDRPWHGWKKICANGQSYWIGY